MSLVQSAVFISSNVYYIYRLICRWLNLIQQIMGSSTNSDTVSLTGFAVGTFVAGIVSDMFGRKRFDLFDFCNSKKFMWSNILWSDQLQEDNSCCPGRSPSSPFWWQRAASWPPSCPTMQLSSSSGGKCRNQTLTGMYQYGIYVIF